MASTRRDRDDRNNVEAYLDIASTDGFQTGDVRGATSAAGQFLYPFDPAAATTDATVRQVKTTHLFFYNNWLHDVWYQKGFDEASRNAQTNNYTRGGAGGDSIKAEGEDRSGTNNANMNTPADGGRPRMQMYRFTGSGLIDPLRDSSTDFGILAHEWMHYMSNRLVGNASGLNNNQGGSMGEGWGDWNGLTQIVRPATTSTASTRPARGARTSSGPATSITTTSGSAAIRTRRVPTRRRSPSRTSAGTRLSRRRRAQHEHRRIGEPRCTTRARSGARCCGKARRR